MAPTSSGVGPSERRRCQPAAAIMAALSVHIARLGRNPWIPSRSHASRICSRSSELAATPPPSTMPVAPTSAAARRALVTSTSTTAAWNDAATSVGRHVGMLAHVVDDRRLQPAEARSRARRPCIARGNADRLRVAVERRPIDRRTARVAEVEEPCDLVERLAGGVVDRLAEQPVPAVVLHLDEHRVPARHQQHDAAGTRASDPRARRRRGGPPCG